jgi:deoxyribodipyrimidine photo-lyase
MYPKPNYALSLKNVENSYGPVIYVMSRDQRVKDNRALYYAQQVALNNSSSLIVLFVLRKTGVRSREHYDFMLKGLSELHYKLESLNVAFVLRIGNPEKIINDLARELKPQEVVFDFNPLRKIRDSQKKIASHLACSVTVIDAHNIIPVWVASDKQEVAAYTFRYKIHRHLEDNLQSVPDIVAHPYESIIKSEFDEQAIEVFCNNVAKSGVKISLKSGEQSASKALKIFMDQKLSSYAHDRNNPTLNGQSDLSPYLHFGQISSLSVAVEVVTKLSNAVPLIFEQAKMPQAGEGRSDYDGVNALLEEMIVRKELSDNFCFYSEADVTKIKSAPNWAQKTLQDHASDTRDYLYSLEQLEFANTHDPAWNAAQNQMLKTGKMHGYMRMYWAKKILEWTESPEAALENCIYLNDKYSIDGGDPNGYVGILWSIAGLHDRPWTEREVFGKIRYMNYGGLKRKFDIEQYCSYWN